MTTPFRRTASLLAALALGSALSVTAFDADAGISRGGGFGSRGARTWSPPAATQMSPRPAAPINRSATQPGQPTGAFPGAAAPRPGGFLNRPGLLGGLAAGFLGAGLFGMLFGHGLFGGLGGLSSVLGLVLQLAIVFFVARWLIGWWQRRNAQPAYAGGPRPASEPLRQAPSSVPSSGARDYGSYGSGASTAEAAPGDAGRLFDPGRDKVGIVQRDLDRFERLLVDIQSAYGRQDVNALRQCVTPEVLGFMQGDLQGDAEQGVVNRISDVRLLDGDLAEAWREGDADYATLSMRYGIEDVVMNRNSGQVVDRGPPEVTEFWTFVRPRGTDWRLSAVQPTG